MSSYPVAYRSSARAQGFQTGPSLAFLDTSKVRELEGAGASKPQVGYGPSTGGIDYGLTGAGVIGIVDQWLRSSPSVPEDDSVFPDRVWPEEINEDWHGADWPDRGQFEDDEAPQSAQPLLIPAMWGWTKTVQCSPCAGQNYTAQRVASRNNFACCTGGAFQDRINNPVLPTTQTCTVYAKLNTTSANNASNDSVWTRNAGTQGVPSPVAIPVVLPSLEPEGDNWLDDLNGNPYDTPWELPLRSPGQIRPRPVWWPTRSIPKPVVRTWPVVVPAPVFTPGPGVIVIVDEDGGVTTEPGPAPAPAPSPGPSSGGAVTTGVPFPAPPGAGEREGKPHGKSAFFLKAMLNIVTEFGDFVDALWKALPKEARKKCKKNGKRKKCSTFDKIMQLGDALYDGHMADSAYWKEAFIQLATNEIVDQFYGRAGRLYAKANAQFGFPQGRGFQTGGWLRRGGAPKSIGGESVSDFVEGYVRKAVNAVSP